MPFRFTLESLLRLRCSVEHQQELLLRAANHRRAEIEGKIESLDRVAAHRREGRERAMAEVVSAAQIHFELICDSVVAEYRNRLEKDRVRAAGACAERAEAFRQARREREILATLRQNYWRDYLRNQDRQAQLDVDYVLLLGRVLRSHR